MVTIVEEGQIFPVKYGEGDTWKCPNCGQEVECPTYDTVEMEHCPECGSSFDCYLVQEVTEVKNQQGRSEFEEIVVEDSGEN